MWWIVLFVYFLVGYSLAIVALDDYEGPAWKESILTFKIILIWPMAILWK